MGAAHALVESPDVPPLRPGTDVLVRGVDEGEDVELARGVDEGEDVGLDAQPEARARMTRQPAATIPGVLRDA
jgi:hypothetical protein